MHSEKLDKNRLRLTNFVTFLMGFSQAMLLYVMSSYFEISSGNDNIGLFYGLSYLIFLAILLNLHKLVSLLGKATVFYFSLLAKIILLVALVLFDPSNATVWLMIAYIIFGNVEWVAMDTIIETFSVDKMSGRIRGFHLTIVNAGFLFGPFISTYILSRMDFRGVFLLTLIFNCFVFIFALIGFRNVNHRFEQKLKVGDILKKVLFRKNIMRIYYISFVLDFFYALMTIYTPVYLKSLGYDWETIGMIFTIMLVPFVILQYPAGFLADKKMGEKEFLIFSILIMGISTAFIYLIDSGTVFLWSLVLFFTRIGASLIEILRDSYFFKKIDATDVDIIDFFRTSSSAAYISASIVSSLILLFLPVKCIFIFCGAVVLSALFPAIRLVDSRSEKESLIGGGR